MRDSTPLTHAAPAFVAVAGLAHAAAAAPLAPGDMLVHEAGEPVAQSEPTDLGDPAGLSGTVLEGDPHVSAPIDHARDGVIAGVFQAPANVSE